MKTTYIILLVLITATVAFSQTSVLSETHTWTSTEAVDLYSGQTLQETFSITLSPDRLIIRHEDITKTFVIQNVRGTWTDLAADGEINFDVLVRDITAIGILERKQGVLSLTVDMSQRKDWMKKKFIVNE